MLPTLADNSKIFMYLFVNFLIIMTDELMHTASKERNDTTHPSYQLLV